MGHNWSQRDLTAFPRSHSEEMAELRFEPGGSLAAECSTTWLVTGNIDMCEMQGCGTAWI